MTLAKKIVMEELKLTSKDVSVRQGRGTAHSWVYITLKTDHLVTHEDKDRVEQRLVAEHVAGTYYSDYGVSNEWYPNVSWRGYYP